MTATIIPEGAVLSNRCVPEPGISQPNLNQFPTNFVKRNFISPFQSYLLQERSFRSAFVPSCVAVTQDVVHPGLRAISLSLNIIIQHLLGSSLAPVVVGRLSDAYGLDKALTFLPGFAFLAGLLLFVGSFYYKRDLFK
jgi:hypothetical protein